MKAWLEKECALRDVMDGAYACARHEVYDVDCDPHVGLTARQVHVLSAVEVAESDLRAHHAAVHLLQHVPRRADGQELPPTSW